MSNRPQTARNIFTEGIDEAPIEPNLNTGKLDRFQSHFGPFAQSKLIFS